MAPRFTVTPAPLRKVRSLGLRTSRRLSSGIRTLGITLTNDGTSLPWSTKVERGVSVQVTDGGCLRLGHGCTLGANTRIVVQGGTLTLGSGVFVGDGCVIVARRSICIGDRVLIAEHVTIRDQDHRVDTLGRIMDAGFDVSPIRIADDVWLGAKCTVLRGADIGAGAIVGAHSLVKGEVPARAIVVGVPARVMRQRAPSHA